MHKFVLALAFIGMLHPVFAQKDYTIHLYPGTAELPERHLLSELTPSDLAPHQYAQDYYLALQFDDILSDEQLANLKRSGISLLAYVPNYTWLARVPTRTLLSTVPARAAFTLRPPHKLSAPLANGDYPAHALQNGSILVQVFPYPGISAEELAEALRPSDCTDIQSISDRVLLVVPQECLLDIAGHPAVMYIEAQAPAPQPEGWDGRTGVRLHSVSRGPRQGYDGSGVSLAIGDDGAVLHEDFRGRITEYTTSLGGNHGDMTAGLAIGAGNLNPLGMGMAPGAYLHLYQIDGYPHIANAVQNYQQRGIVITSTSYGDVCGGHYTQATQDIDRQVFQQPEILHCFSAGNSGESACSVYSNTRDTDNTYYGNITGGMKAGKNVITVGNTSYDDRLMLSSSRGPTLDGRIKPDLCAHGQGNLSTDPDNGYRPGGGTSAAAPTVAGALATLYQAFRTLNNGTTPASALIKSAVLCTADDLGNAGPDYKTGWGRLHTARALEVLQRRNYFASSVAHGSSRNFEIMVPNGARQVRIMLYWHDREALPQATKTLVNDLDLTVTTPNSTTLLPWVLSQATHIDSLRKPARRGVDRVNNVEQVTLDNPTAGRYAIQVHGHLVPQGPQPFYIVYYVVQEELTLSYPSGGEGFVPNETETIRWDAFGNAGAFRLEYSINGGASWSLIANNIAGHLRHYDWQVPNTPGGRTLVRISRNGVSATSGSTFTILDLPDCTFRYQNTNQVAIRWNRVPSANIYDVFALGNHYMDSIGTTTDTTFLAPIAAWQSNWYAVRARHVDGATGRRSNAKYYQHRPCDAQLTLQLRFDLYPAETSWDIRDAQNRIWMSGGPYLTQSASSTLLIDVCLPFGCYTLNMYDKYNDGMCCNYGNGSYRLTDATGNVLAQGAQFGSFESKPFCVNTAPAAPLSLQVSQVQAISCFGEQNGRALASASGGSGNYSYQWSHGASGALATNLAAGTYSVTVSDGQTQRSAGITIGQPAAIQVGFGVQAPFCGQANGVLSAIAQGGVSPYRYQWSTGAQASSIQGLPAGTYSVTVTDANGCKQSAAFTLQGASSLIAHATATNALCHNTATGTATLTVSGGTAPYQYAWSHGASGAVATNLVAGTYTATVTDSQGCQKIVVVQIANPPAIQLNFAVTHTPGGHNGAINLTVFGGSPPYRYLWSNGAISEDIQQLGAGVYSVTVTDSKQCTATGSATVEGMDPTQVCQARGSNTQFEWIEQVQISNWGHHSGNNNGYGNFLHITPTLTAGRNHTLQLIPGYAGSGFKEYWRIWIDFNQDGDFNDPNEEVFAANDALGVVSGTLLIPNQHVSMTTRMRISMRYGTPPNPCGIFAYGETEDYTITIVPAANADNNVIQGSMLPTVYLPPPAYEPVLRLWPNPANTYVQIRYFSRQTGALQLAIYDVQGRPHRRWQADVHEGFNDLTLTIDDIQNGFYQIHAASNWDTFTQPLIILK